MKTAYFLSLPLIAAALLGSASAQKADSLVISSAPDGVKVMSKDTTKVLTQVADSKEDTTVIKINNRKVVIVNHADGDTDVKIAPKSPADIEAPEAPEPPEAPEAPEWDSDDDDDCDDCSRKRYDVDVRPFTMDLGFSNFIDSKGNFGDMAEGMKPLGVKTMKSLHTALHIMPTNIPLTPYGHISLQTAISLDFNWYHFQNGSLKLSTNADTLVMGSYDNAYKKNKLRTGYAQIPLLLAFNTRPGNKNNVHIAVGGFAGLRMGAKQILVSSDNKTKNEGDYNLADFRYGLTARFDFRWIDLYANYSLTPTFNAGQGLNGQTFSVGLNLIDIGKMNL